MLAALIGGIIIGFASFLLMFFIGRISGISGIVGRVLPPHRGDRDWRLAFVLGLILGGAAMFAQDASRFSSVVGEPGSLQIIIAGLLVGFGTRLGSGCTSGHGVCGISRQSGRSLVATVVFIGAGVITVALMSALGASS
jgi:uncharacterized membrane protein YedE/YeeE